MVFVARLIRTVAEPGTTQPLDTCTLRASLLPPAQHWQHFTLLHAPLQAKSGSAKHGRHMALAESEYASTLGGDAPPSFQVSLVFHEYDANRRILLHTVSTEGTCEGARECYLTPWIVS